MAVGSPEAEGFRAARAVGAEGYRAPGPRGSWVWPKPRAAEQLELYRPIAGHQSEDRRLLVSLDHVGGRLTATTAMGLAEAVGYRDVRAMPYWPNADMQRRAHSPRGRPKTKAAKKLGTKERKVAEQLGP